jgi:hypothetical protein
MKIGVLVPLLSTPTYGEKPTISQVNVVLLKPTLA